MIEVESLSRSYGTFKAVDDVSFTIRQGEIVGLLGHNGAGKSTIMKMLTGFLEPTGGRIRINQRAMPEQRRAIQHEIGYLPEFCPLYRDMVVMDYLAYRASLQGVAAADQPAAIREAIRRTALEDKALDPIHTLSRGYQQRVGVAQAILHQPGIVILDEPTNGLDPGQIQHMRDLIMALAAHATIIVSTHILQEVEAVCERVLMIRGGRLALDANLRELTGADALVVTLGGEATSARTLLAELAGVAGVHVDHDTHDTCRLLIELTDAEAADRVAPAVAKTVQAAGFSLHELRRRTRDLETVFRQVNEVKEDEWESAHA